MPAAGPVTIDKSDLIDLNKSLAIIKDGSRAAIRFATNDMLAALKNDSARIVGERITAKISAIKKDFTVNKMTVADPTADITCQGNPLPLAAYKHSKTMKGAKVQVFKPGTTKLVKHSFSAQMKSGHKGLFWRKEKIKGTGKWPVGKYRKLPSPPPKGVWSPLKEYQLKIKELYGPRIPDIFFDDKVMNPVLAKASVRYDDRLEYHTQRLMDSAK